MEQDMSKALDRYRELEEELIRIRWLHGGFDSDEEDRDIDEMDRLWWAMSEEERHMLEAEPRRSYIRDAAPRGPRIEVDRDMSESTCAPRHWVEAA